MLSFSLLACRSAPPPREVELERFDAEVSNLERIAADAALARGSGLRFVLAFGEAADLDLFVTGPRQETVYFANTPTAVGGELEVDARRRFQLREEARVRCGRRPHIVNVEHRLGRL